MVLLQSSAEGQEYCPDTPVGTHCFIPSADWQSDATCILVGSRRVCHVPRSRQFLFTLRISVRQLRVGGKKNSKPLDNFWIRGSGPGLGWDYPVLLKKSGRGVGLWVTDISYTQDSKGRLCSKRTHCLLNQNFMEFRVYQDENGKYDMIGPNLYVDLPIPHSMFGHPHFISPLVDVHPWFHGKAITVEGLDLSNLPPPFPVVKTQLLYPPSFDYNARRKYSVIILLGTQGEGLRVSPLLETMFVHEASIQEAFVVNIYINDSSPYCVLNPYSKLNAGSVNSIWKCKHGEQCKSLGFCWFSQCDVYEFKSKKDYLHPVKCGGKGDVLLDIIEEHLVPKLKSVVQDRLLISFPRNRLGIIGYDGAGLLACHAAISRPHVYQNIACMSAPFHWPLNVALNHDSISFEDTGISNTMFNFSEKFIVYPENRYYHTTQKYFIDYGEKDNHHVPLIDTEHYVDQFIERLKIDFAVPSENIFVLKSIKRSHNNYFLRKDGGTEVLNRIKMPLLFFLRAKGGPNIEFPDLSSKPAAVAKKDETEEETKDIEVPKECIQEIRLTQRRMAILEHHKDIPVEALGLTIRKQYLNL